MGPSENTPQFDAAKSIYVHRMVVKGWKLFTWIMLLGLLLSGLAIEFGPTNTRGGVVFRLMDNIGVINEIVAYSMIVAAALLLFRKTATAGHFLGGVCYCWFSCVVLYLVVFTDQQTSLTSAIWALTLGPLHVVSGAVRVAVGRFLKRLGADGRGTAHG